MIWYDMIWYDVTWFDMILYDMICFHYIRLYIAVPSVMLNSILCCSIVYYSASILTVSILYYIILFYCIFYYIMPPNPSKLDQVACSSQRMPTRPPPPFFRAIVRPSQVGSGCGFLGFEPQRFRVPGLLKVWGSGFRVRWPQLEDEMKRASVHRNFAERRSLYWDLRSWSQNTSRIESWGPLYYKY